MQTQWFYGQEGHKLGPYTALELRALAIAGTIVATDTVWKEGIDRGVLAARVKNLLPPAAPFEPVVEIEAIVSTPAVVTPVLADAPAVQSGPVTAVEGAVAERAIEERAVEEQAAVMAPASSYQPPVAKKPAKKSRATAIQGAKITSQDGTYVQFTKICNKCGYQDPSRTTMPINQGTTRMTFYCRKCRKARAVEIQGLN